VLLQADLTAVAPGYLAPVLTEKLLLMADAEGQGPATIYRFSPVPSAGPWTPGQDAAALLEFLREHSATAVPQPLQYLVEDTAARHGRLRVGAAASFVQSEDEAALLELLQGKPRGLGLVRIAPTVLVSMASPRKRRSCSRAGTVASPWKRPDPPSSASTAPPCAGTGRPVYTAPRTPFPTRTSPPSWTCSASHAEHVVSHPPGRLTPAARQPPSWGWRPCSAPSGSEAAVSMNVVDSMGNANLETVVPLSVSGGRVRVFDPAKDTERVLSIHRIIDIEAAEEMRQ
jgi:hypothetical protein